jgi:tetratricopeptide (TPR) repeat protein
MKRVSFVAASLLSASLLASSAAASIVVLGNSVGRSCYVSATMKIATREAIADCTSALSSGQLSAADVVATHVNRGIIRIFAEQLPAAIADFDRAIALDPGQPESYLNKASAIMKMSGNPSEAIALYNESLERKTRRPELAYYGRAVAHETSGNLTAAYNDYRRAQQLAPRWKEPGMELSRFQVRRLSSQN